MVSSFWLDHDSNLAIPRPTAAVGIEQSNNNDCSKFFKGVYLEENQKCMKANNYNIGTCGMCKVNKKNL